MHYPDIHSVRTQHLRRIGHPRRMGFLALLGVMFWIGCQRGESDVAPEKPIRPVLSIAAAPRGGIENGYSGIIEPRYQTNLSFRLLGQIVTREVNVGDQVKVGQTLATIDPVVLKIAVDSAEAALANATAQRENAEGSLERQTQLLAKNATSQAEFDVAKKNAEAAISAVAQAQADLDKAREELSYASLKSDIDGVVMAIDSEVGQTVSAGQTVITVANPDLREAVVDIGEDVIGTISVGTEYRLQLQLSNKVECVGKVREIAPQVDTKTRTSRVRISLVDPPEGFRLGATIRAYSLSDSQPRLFVPATAILDRDGQSFVWVVDTENKIVNRKPVKIAARGRDGVDIESGISAGERIVTAGVHRLEDGQPIRWREGDWQ